MSKLNARITESSATSIDDKIACPYVYAKGKRCPGHVVRVEAFKADISWTLDSAGHWIFQCGEPQSHYHVYCSVKDNHAGYGREDALKYYYNELPKEIQAVISKASR